MPQDAGVNIPRPTPSESTGSGSMSTTRLEAFSDGVFAVAATVLVFGFSVPSAPSGQLASRLIQDWPEFAAYAVSFVSIGVVWVNHHSAFSQIRQVDRPLLFINLILLMTVAFLPFPTDVLAHYLRSPHDAGAATALYGITMTMLSMAFAGIFIRVSSKGLLNHDVDPAMIRHRMRWRSLGIVIWPAATALGFVNAEVALGAFALITIFYVVDPLRSAVAR